MTTETKDHLWQQFDKLLVSALLLFSFWLLIHNLKYYLGVDSVINQTWGVVTFFLGLLSGLITGGMKTRASDKNGNGNGNGYAPVAAAPSPEVPPPPASVTSPPEKVGPAGGQP